MDLYEHEFGYDPREPKSISFYTEEETIERHAQHIVFWRNLLAEYDVKEPSDIHKVKTNIRWQYITKKADETALTFYLKLKKRYSLIAYLQTLRFFQLLDKWRPLKFARIIWLEQKIFLRHQRLSWNFYL